MRYCRTHHLKNPLSGIKFALSVTRLAESPENDGSMLSQHSLNKGRSKRLVSAVAALSLFFGAAHVAPTASAQEIGAKFSIDEDEYGYRIASGSTNHQIRTELFSATAQAGGEKRLAYCTEWEVNFQKTNDAYAAKWSDFPGKNSFKTDENVRQKINWIAANSYPAVSYETVLQKAGVTSTQVSKKSVIAQTQAAIWNLGSGFDYKGLAQGEGTAEEQANAKKVYEYLLGPANVGRAESTSVDLQVGFKGKDTATRQANGTFGPFTLDTNADSVEVTAETGQVVDKNGNAFPANEIKNGQEFYFKAEEQAGSAKLIAKAASSEVNGALIISPKQGGNGHHQTLIVTHDKSKTKEAELYIEWEGTNARLSTTARKKGDEHSQRVKSKGGTIVDIVAYEGLIVGKEYTLKGQLYERVKQDDGTYKGVATDIKSEKKFTPTQAKDEVHLEFEIPEGYAGKTLVVFEEAYGPDGKLIAKHADINDENQTIYVNQPYQDMSSDSSAAKTGSAGAMFAGSSKCFSGGAAGGSSKKEDKNKGSLGDLFAGSSSLFGGDKDKDKGGSDSNGGSTNGGNGNGGSNANGGSTGDNKDNNGSTSGSTGGGNGNGGGNGGANGGSDSKTGSDAGAVAGSAGGAAGGLLAGSSDKDKDKKGNGSTAGSSGDNKGNGNGNGQGNGGSDGKSGSDINSTSDTNGGSNAGSSGEGKGNGQGNGQGNGNGGSNAGSSGEGKGNGQGNGGANGGSDSKNKNGSAALAGSTSGADCGGALALGALAVGGLVLTAVGFNVLAKNAASAPLAGAADPKSDTKGAAPAAGDPNKNNKNAANANTKGAEPKEKGVAHKDPNTSKMDVKSASPAKSNSALANTGVSGILIMLAIAAVAAVAGGALIFFGRRKKN